MDSIAAQIAHAKSEMFVHAYIDAKNAIAHNKIIIIDRQIFITDSFNFTKGVEGKMLRIY